MVFPGKTVEGRIGIIGRPDRMIHGVKIVFDRGEGQIRL
jgi:hypothetical protein